MAFIIIIVVLMYVLLHKIWEILVWLRRQRKKIKSTKRRRKCRQQRILALVLVIAFVSLGFTAKAKFDANKKDILITKISFEPEQVNDKAVIWQELINTNLYFSYLEELLAKGYSNDQIRNHYIQGIGTNRTLSHVDFKQVKYIIEKFYGTELLPISEKTLEEIKELTPPLEERCKTDAILFQEEFSIRAQKCTEGDSFECFYQAARSADDAFKQLVKDGNTKEVVFFAAMSVAYYMMSLEKLEDGEHIWRSFIEYRISEIFICLRDNCIVQDSERGELYELHFLLITEAYLKHSQVIYDLAKTGVNIHEEHMYHDKYMADTIYRLITEHEFESIKEMKDECKEYANSYIGTPNAKQSGIDSCNLYLTMLGE